MQKASSDSGSTLEGGPEAWGGDLGPDALTESLRGVARRVEVGRSGCWLWLSSDLWG